jgi:hypothetical protein
VKGEEWIKKNDGKRGRYRQRNRELKGERDRERVCV